MSTIKTWEERAEAALGYRYTEYKCDTYRDAEIADLRTRVTELEALAQQQAGVVPEEKPEVIEWSYSTNEENYQGGEDSREAIIQAALDEIGEQMGTFWIGKNKRFAGRGDANGVIESLQEQAYEECGEFAETYLDDVTKAEEKELADFITNWAARVDRSNFWTVCDVEKIDIEAALASKEQAS